MFNRFNKENRINFSSNPYLQPEPVIRGIDQEGRTINHVEFVPVSNVSLLDGTHFDEQTQGLRAKLNMGVKMSEVSNVNIDDFAAAYSKINLASGYFDAYFDQSASQNQEAEKEKSE